MKFRLWCSETITKIVSGEKILVDPPPGTHGATRSSADPG